MKKALFLFYQALAWIAINTNAQVFYDLGGYTNTNVVCNPHGSGFFDYNGDNWDDVFVVHNFSTQTYEPLKYLPHTLLKNMGNGQFTNVTTDAGVRGYLNISAQGFAAGDYNNDGFIDLCIGMGNTYFQALVYRNNQNGTFSDVSFSVIGDSYTFHGRCVAFFDYNNDGWIDLLFLRDDVTTDPSDYLFALYQNNRRGGFTNMTTSAGLGIQGTVNDLYGFALGDADNDGDLDFYVPRLTAQSLYLRNDNGTFHEVAAQVGLPNDQNCIGALFFDYNNDGFFDLFIKRQDLYPQLFANNKNGTFTDVSWTTDTGRMNTGRITSDCAFGGGLTAGDFDNDGYTDVLLINRYGYLTKLLHNEAGARFTDISVSAGLNDAFDYYWTSPVGDYNHDGYLDIYMARGPGIPNPPPWAAMYKNNGGSRKWIQLSLTGVASNKSAIGAQVFLYGNGQIQTRQVQGGDGYKTNSFLVHFGLGNALTVDSMLIRWPSGIRQKLLSVPSNQILRISEKDTVMYFGPLYIAGEVRHLQHTAAKLKQVYLAMTGDETRNVTSNMDGTYKFTPITPGEKNLTVTPTKTRNDDVGTGAVTAYDAALVLRTVLKLDTLSALQRSVAETDGNGVLDAADAAFIGRHAVGLKTDARSRAGTWTFVPANRTYTSVLKFYNGENFGALVVGDVSMNWGTEGAPGKAGRALRTSEPFVEPADTSVLRIPVKVEAGSGMVSGDFVLSYDPSALAFLGAETSDLTESFFLVANEARPGRVSIALYGAEPVTGSGVILNVVFRRTCGCLETAVRWESAALNEQPIELPETVIRMSGAGIGPERPGAFGLRPNFPNPFNPETSVVYTTDAGGDVSLAVYDVQGREVRRLADGYLEAGTYTVVWDGRDAKGVEVPSGSYFCRFRAGSRNAVIKMLKSK